MSRFLGFVVGALLVFGGLYYLLTPAGLAPETAERELTLPSAGPSVPGPQTEPASAADESAEPAPPPASPRPSQPAGAVPVRLADRSPGPDRAPSAIVADIADEQALVEQALAAMQAPQPSEIQSEAVTPTATQAATVDTHADTAVPEDTQWFAVWQPFHSEYSADAFAGRLERMTGLDYRVVRSGPANYEVAVAFRSEQERVANIALIEEATGLRIAGGSL